MPEQRSRLGLEFFAGAACAGAALLTGGDIVTALTAGFTTAQGSRDVINGVVQRYQNRRDQSFLNHDLQRVLIKAFQTTIEQLQREYRANPEYQNDPDYKANTAFFGDVLKKLSDDDVLAELILKTHNVEHYLIGKQADSTLTLWEISGAAKHLHSYNSDFREFIKQRLQSTMLFFVGEELKADNPLSNRAWRAYQRFLYEELHTNLKDVLQHKTQLADALSTIEEQVTVLQSDMERRYESIDEPFQDQLMLFQQRQEAKLDRLAQQSLQTMAYASDIYSIVAARVHIKPAHKMSKLERERELFQSGLIYHSDTEEQILQQMQHTLDARQSAFLVGAPATGKSILARTFAIRQQRWRPEKCLPGFRLQITAKLETRDVIQELISLLQDVTRSEHKAALLVVEDCHLNPDVAAQVYDQVEEHPALVGLFVSRRLPEVAQRAETDAGEGFFEAMQERPFELTASHDQQFRDKTRGIVETYQKFYEQAEQRRLETGERTEKRTFEVGDWERVQQNIGRNYLSLYYALKFWQDADIERLDQLDESTVLEKIYKEYLADNNKYGDRTLTLRYAALYQYEIPFVPPDDRDDRAAFAQLERSGILEDHEDRGFYAFHHSEFALLLLRSYLVQPRVVTTLDGLTIDEMRHYLQQHRLDGQIFHNVVTILANQEATKILSGLLDDEAIREQARQFYEEEGTARSLEFFVSVSVRLSESNHGKFFVKTLVIENSKIKSMLLKSAEPNVVINRFARLARAADIYGVSEKFTQQFNNNDLEKLITESSFVPIGMSLAQLQARHRLRALARKLLDLATGNNLTNDEQRHNALLGKAADASFAGVGKALSDLRNVDVALAREILQDLTGDKKRYDALLGRAADASFADFGYALSSLRNVDVALARKILQNLTDDKKRYDALLGRAADASFAGVGKALSELRGVDVALARKILQNLTDDKKRYDALLGKAADASFADVGKALNELRNVDVALARKILQNLTDDKKRYDALLGRAANASFGRLGIALAGLVKVDTSVAARIYESLPLPNLTEKIRVATKNQIQPHITVLARLSPERTRELLRFRPDCYTQALRRMLSYLSLE